MKVRRYDIDWLRVLATLTIFLFHCARFFDPIDWHLKNAERSTVLTMFVVVLATWEMPLFFLIGYLIPADKRFTESYKRDGWLGLVLGLAGTVGGAYMFLGLGYNPMEGESFSRTFVIFQIVWAIASWGWIVFILSMGARYLNFSSRVLTYANEAVLPFYILHQTVILAVGWFIIPLDLSILVKYLVIASGSFLIIMTLYELLIKRFNVLRFLFGMRLRKKTTEAQALKGGVHAR